MTARFPTAADLDAVAPENPVFLVSRSAHAGWVNSLALRLCGIDAETPDPNAAEIARDSTGAPTGILLEPASMALVARHIPAQTVESLATQMKATQQVAHSLGITGIHDFDDQECFRGAPNHARARRSGRAGGQELQQEVPRRGADDRACGAASATTGFA